MKLLPTARGHKREEESRTRARGMMKGKCASGLLSKDEDRGCFKLPTGKECSHSDIILKRKTGAH